MVLGGAELDNHDESTPLKARESGTGGEYEDDTQLGMERQGLGGAKYALLLVVDEEIAFGPKMGVLSARSKLCALAQAEASGTSHQYIVGVHEN